MKFFRFWVALAMITVGAGGATAASRNPDTFIICSPQAPQTLDPALADDPASRHCILNIYETLVFADPANPDQLIPKLAAEVPSLTNGGISPEGTTYSFIIRSDVKFHHGEGLTAEDAAYSLKRAMIMAPSGNESFPLLEALTGEPSLRDAHGVMIPGVWEKIENSIAVAADTMMLRLPRPYPPLLRLLSHASAAIISKNWAMAHQCWDGDRQQAAAYQRPVLGQEPLRTIASGTNAYRLNAWTPPEDLTLEQFEAYWGEKPVLKTVVFQQVKDGRTRKQLFADGAADRIAVEAGDLPEIQRIEGAQIVKSPELSVSCAIFCRRLRAVENPNIGSGRLDGQGIPPDFLTDENVRLAFLRAFDRNAYRQTVLQNLATSPATPHIEGLAFYQDAPEPEFSPEKAAEHLKQAWNGQVWEQGFYMTIAYNTGNDLRRAAAYMLAETIMGLNPKFRIEVISEEWSRFRAGYQSFSYPVFISGWSADSPDPHNIVQAFMRSDGVFAKAAGLHNPEIDALCDQGMTWVDPQARERVYIALQNLWHKEAIGISLYQPISLRAYRPNVRGHAAWPRFEPEWDDLKRLHKE